MKKTFWNIALLGVLALVLALAGCPTGGGDDDDGDSVAPGAVSDLSGTAGDGSVTLTWTDPVDANLDHIEITWTSGPDTRNVPAGDQTRTITGLGNDTPYTFTLTAVDTSGNKSGGETITLMPVAPNPFTDVIVTALKAINVDDDEATLTWTDPVDANLDHIEITWTPGGNTPESVTSGAQSKTITSLTADTEYTFFVRAVDGDGHKSRGVSITLTPNFLQKWTVLKWNSDNPSNFPKGQMINDIVWGGPSTGQKFVAVGAKGGIVHSPNGVNWTAVTDSTFGTHTTQSTINGIAWGGPSAGQKFVAVGVLGKMAYSSDGVTWTAVTSNPFDAATNGGTALRIGAIAWGGPSGGQKFVAAGDSGKMAYSSDGENWTSVNSTLTKHIYRLSYDGPAGQQIFMAGVTGQTIVSTDGTSWTPSSITGSVMDMAYGGGKFVCHVASFFAAWSSDGTNWTRVAEDQLSGTPGNAIAWGGPAGSKRFVIVASSAMIAYSEVIN
jgi:chitodextrinase